VANPEQQTMRSAKIVLIDSHAAATLRYIRASMDAAASLAVPGSAGLAMGIVGLLAAAFSSSPNLHKHWLAIWLVAAVLAAGLGGSLVARRSSWRALTLVGTPARKFVLCLFPALFAGMIMTGVHWYYGNLRAIPPTWLLLYGCALIAASATTTRTIGVLGGSFVTLGLLALILPEGLQIPMLAVGFGGLHILFGFFIGRMAHGQV
jgi:hypothetical protein